MRQVARQDEETLDETGDDHRFTNTQSRRNDDREVADGRRQRGQRARQADVAMAPAADMFEMGVNVQVLPGGEIFLALDRGAIDAAEFVAPTTMKNWACRISRNRRICLNGTAW